MGDAAISLGSADRVFGLDAGDKGVEAREARARTARAKNANVTKFQLHLDYFTYTN